MPHRFLVVFLSLLLSLPALAAVSLSITVDHLDPVPAGATIHYVVRASNEGPDDAVNPQVTFTLPAEAAYAGLGTLPADWTCSEPAVGTMGAVVTCNAALLPPGTATLPIDATTDPALEPGSISGSASVTSDSPDPDSDDNTTPITVVIVSSADIAVAIDASPNPVVAADALDVTIVVTSNGPSASDAELTYLLPAELTFDALDAPAGWSCTVPAVGTNGTVVCSLASMDPGTATFTVHTHVDPAATGTITSIATVVSSGDTVPANDEASVDTNVTVVAPVTIEKIARDFSGSAFTYELTVANAGPSSAHTVTVTDVLPVETLFAALDAPAGWSCTTPAVGANGTVQCTNALLAAGPSAVFVIDVTIAPGFPVGTIIENTATVGTTTNSDSETISNAIAEVDLSIAITDAPDPVAPGGTVVYTVTATNAGPDAAPNARIAFSGGMITPPAGWSCAANECTAASFGPGTASFSVSVAAPDTPGGTVTLTASITSDAFESAPNDNTDSESTAISTGSLLSGTKSASGSALGGSVVTFTIVVRNDGAPQPDNPGDELVDDLPDGLELLGASATSGTAAADLANDRVTWNGALASGASVTITITARVDPQPPASMVNVATIHYDADANGTNETSVQTNAVALAGAVAIPLAAHEVLLLIVVLLAALGAYRLT